MHQKFNPFLNLRPIPGHPGQLISERQLCQHCPRGAIKVQNYSFNTRKDIQTLTGPAVAFAKLHHATNKLSYSEYIRSFEYIEEKY